MTEQPIYEQLREQYNQWLSNLKVGDQVCLEYHDYSTIDRSVTNVSKITPKRWISVEKRPDHYFKDGEERTGSSKWHSSWYKIVPLTPEIEEEIKVKFALNVIKNTNFDNLSPEQIKEIYKIIHVKPQQ